MKKILTTAIAIILTSCGILKDVSANTTPNPVVSTQTVTKVEHGLASWYGVKCNGGTKTASGIILKDHASYAAHKTLPMGTRVRVVNLSNGKSEVVKIVDRGPFKKGRVIDVTTGVAKRIGFYSNGITKVKLEVLK